MSKLSVATDLALQGPDFPMTADTIENILLTGILAAVETAAGTGDSGSVFRGSPTISTGSLLVTGVAEDIVSEDLTRTYVEFINTSASGTIWLTFGANASTSGVAIPVAAGGSWYSPPNWCPTGRVSVAGTASDTFTIITA